jgi:hypothetical protein
VKNIEDTIDRLKDNVSENFWNASCITAHDYLWKNCGYHFGHFSVLGVQAQRSIQQLHIRRKSA